MLSLFPLPLLLLLLLCRVTTDLAGRTALIGLVLQYFPQKVEFITMQFDVVK